MPSTRRRKSRSLSYSIRSLFLVPTIPTLALLQQTNSVQNGSRGIVVNKDTVQDKAKAWNGRDVLGRRFASWRNQVICPLHLPCPAPFAKIFWFTSDPNHRLIFGHPVPLAEGRIAIVTDVGHGMRWTQAVPKTRALRLRTAKSCGPDAPALASSSR